MRNNCTKVYYAKLGKMNLAKKLKYLPESKLARIANFENEKDKKLSVGSYLLLKKILRKHLIRYHYYDFKYLDNGKPIIQGKKIDFSISHSGNYVAVAISKKPVGVDIQEIKDIDFDSRKFVFDDEDENVYQKSLNKKDVFYSLWVAKEAKFKMDGTPFKNGHLKDAKIYTIDNYKIGVSCQTKKIKIKKSRI